MVKNDIRAGSWLRVCGTARENGWVAEWTKAVVLKTTVRVRVPWVRIPPHPLAFMRRVIHVPLEVE